MTSKKERLEECLRRLARAASASTLDEARKLLDDTLEAVEDEMSGVPNNPTPWCTDGRMYPVQDDNFRELPEQSGVVRLRSRDHYIFIATNGAIRVVQVSTSEVALDKPGRDGMLVPSGVQ